MARRRMMDPSFWTDEISGCSKTARLLFLGLISHADDEGRLSAYPKVLNALIFGLDQDETPETVEAALDELTSACRSVIRYEVGGRPYIQLRRWNRYQRIEKGYASEFPPPEGWAPEETRDRIPLRTRKNTSRVEKPAANDPRTFQEQPATVPDLVSPRSDFSAPKIREEKKREEEEPRARANGTLIPPAAGYDDAHPLFEPYFAKCAEACYGVDDPRELRVQQQGELRVAANECIRLGVELDSIDALIRDWSFKSLPYPKQLAANALRVQNTGKVKAKARGQPKAVAAPEPLPPRVTAEDFKGPFVPHGPYLGGKDSE